MMQNIQVTSAIHQLHYKVSRMATVLDDKEFFWCAMTAIAIVGSLYFELNAIQAQAAICGIGCCVVQSWKANRQRVNEHAYALDQLIQPEHHFADSPLNMIQFAGRCNVELTIDNVLSFARFYKDAVIGQYLYQEKDGGAELRNELQTKYGSLKVTAWVAAIVGLAALACAAVGSGYVVRSSFLSKKEIFGLRCLIGMGAALALVPYLQKVRAARQAYQHPLFINFMDANFVHVTRQRIDEFVPIFNFGAKHGFITQMNNAE